MKIQLLSDLCVTNGHVYNSSVDIEVCQDSYGMPFIPAKRIKGCLREVAEELNEWGQAIDINYIFGVEGNQRGVLTLDNAYLEHYDDYQKALEDKTNSLCHPVNVLNTFTYLRTQTAINYETGAADQTSLRTMRVINKGLEFISEVELPEKYVDQIKLCCLGLRHMGLHRTRGLGRVKVTFDKKIDSLNNDENMNGNHHLPDSGDRLDYVIHLKEPVVVQSANRRELETLDYIEGGQILGLIAGLKGDEFISFDNGTIKCTNAYPYVNQTRALEAPASMYEVKDDSSKYYDMIHRSNEPLERVQISRMKHCYISYDDKGNLIKTNPMTEMRYHHRRPKDKSYGHAIPDDPLSQFYSISSIKEGQSFAGSIYGTEQQINDIVDLLIKNPNIRLGAGRSSEYGRCIIELLDRQTTKKEKKTTKHFYVKLNSPAIIYNEHAFASADIKDLKAEIEAMLKNDDSNNEIQLSKEASRNFVKTTTIGGYNVQWQLRKPSLEVFDKGTVIKFDTQNDVVIESGPRWIGERNSEGYGEVEVCDVLPSSFVGYVSQKQNEKSSYEELDCSTNELYQTIAKTLFKRYLKNQAINLANHNIKTFTPGVLRPTVSNMLLMIKDLKNLGDVKDAVYERYHKKTEGKDEKEAAANKIIATIKNEFSTQREAFEKDYCLKNFVLGPNVEMEFLKDYLVQLKYELRKISK
ncbi:MAG: hypothetical protein J6P61_01410 [Erysipelotrichaceae bacterium]|nr:hypothetical protein [Erysipelotrichaceae bacterium]